LLLSRHEQAAIHKTNHNQTSRHWGVLDFFNFCSIFDDAFSLAPLTQTQPHQHPHSALASHYPQIEAAESKLYQKETNIAKPTLTRVAVIEMILTHLRRTRSGGSNQAGSNQTSAKSRSGEIAVQLGSS
jgi:hypothetical protein